MATTGSSAARPDHIAELERLAFKWEEVAQYDTTALSFDRRVQVRESNHYLDKNLVTRYRHQMGQAKFPAVIVTQDGYICDGNNRLEAHRLRGERYVAAIVIKENYADATPNRQREFRALAATLNNLSGQPLTAKESREAITPLIELGWLPAQIQRVVGAKVGDINRLKWEIAAHARLQRVGLTNGEVRARGASLRALGKPSTLGLNDAPYKALAELAMDAALNTTEVVTIAKAADATGSDVEALAYIAAQRADRLGEIKDKALTGSSKPPAARMLRQRLGYINGFADNPAGLIEANPPTMQSHIAYIETAQAVLADVLALQVARLAEAEDGDD